MRLHRLGVPKQGINELLTMWHEDLIRQLTNYPADMRIERWLKESYAGLAEVQEQSIRKQLRENEQVLTERISDFTPAKVYKASVTMNAVFARFRSLLYQDESPVWPYRRTPYWDSGYPPADEIWESGDAGYKSDVEAAKEWASYFDLEGWFEWKRVDEIE